MKHWALLEEKGLVWGMDLLLKIFLLLGRGVLQLFLYPVVSYYWLFNRSGRQASQEYLQRISTFPNHSTINTGLKGSFLHFINFANALIDKLAAWSGKLTVKDVEYYGRDAVINYIDQGQGVLILGSHLGNLEICRVIANQRKKVTINVLVHTKHTEKFNTVLNKYATSGIVHLIQVTQVNAATAMMLKDKIEDGEMVIIAADRTPVGGQGRIAYANFLGQRAAFPQGAFILALLLKCPVFTLFCLNHQGQQTIYFDQFSEAQNVPRKHRDQVIQQSVEKFATRLQDYCLKEPLQWFNFYDFWQIDDE